MTYTIKADTSQPTNYPQIEAQSPDDPLAAEVNKRFADLWVHQNDPQFPTIDQMVLDVLAEDYIKRHTRAKPND